MANEGPETALSPIASTLPQPPRTGEDKELLTWALSLVATLQEELNEIRRVVHILGAGTEE